MRIASVRHEGERRFGVVADGGLRLVAPGVDLYDALAADTIERHLTDDLVALAADAPREVPMPVATIRDFITFEQHTAGSLRAVTGADVVPEAWYEAPAFYFTNPHAALGSGQPVPMPPGCTTFDFELEVAAVIGRAGYNLTVDEAQECIVGYTILNDWSARDLQRREMRVGLGPAKGKDTATTLGPELVTVDELAGREDGDRLALGMSVRVGDDLIGEDNLRQMAWSFAELISYASRGTWVRPGDVIGSGTAGGGCLAELWGWNGEERPAPLRIGDTVTMTVEGLGTIRNTVVAGPEIHEIPRARRVEYVPPTTN